jgi:hypothetical protein
MNAIISRAEIVGGHDGRAEIEVELTYPNGGKATLSLDEEACTASLDRAGVRSLEELLGQPWSVVLPALEHAGHTMTKQHQTTPNKQQQLQPLENHA